MRYDLFAGDVFYARWDEVLVGATAVVSTLGGFGNEEQMKKINGEANIVAVDAAKEYGMNRYISFLTSIISRNLFDPHLGKEESMSAF